MKEVVMSNEKKEAFKFGKCSLSDPTRFGVYAVSRFDKSQVLVFEGNELQAKGMSEKLNATVEAACGIQSS
jgi:hypothetical protein